MLKLDLKHLLSKQRLSSYNNDIKEHFDNLRLIVLITPKLATLEICIRNRLDFILLQENENWLLNLNDEKVQAELFKIARKENATNLADLNHHQYISRLTLGIFVRIIKLKKMETLIFDVKNIDFRKYDKNNTNFYYLKGRKSHISHILKAKIILNLILMIRNRSYHWENLLKMRENTSFPRLSTKENNLIIGICPNKIQTFLNDLLKSMNKDLLKYCGLELK